MVGAWTGCVEWTVRGCAGWSCASFGVSKCHAMVSTSDIDLAHCLGCKMNQGLKSPHPEALLVAAPLLRLQHEEASWPERCAPENVGATY